MAITTQDFTTLVRNMVTAVQGTASALVDLTVGSVLLAVVQAQAAVTLWLQGLILSLLAITRAATSSGTDLDTWVADFGLTRIAAIAATGQVTFSRFTATSQAVIPVGATIQTGDGTEEFTVTEDTTNSAYSADDSGYIVAAGVASITVPVTASTAGSGGNISAGQLNTLTTAITGVDTVTNAAAYTNGSDAETDAALRTRFISYILGLAKATKTSIGNAISSLATGITYTLVENQQYNGATDYGYFYAVVDDGTGSPTSTFLSNVANAIESVRGFTIRYGVFAPVVVPAAVSMTITTASGYDHATVVGTVATALQTYINSLTLGQSLPYSILAKIAYDASDGVTNVTAVTLNGGTADLSATSKQVLKASTITVA